MRKLAWFAASCSAAVFLAVYVLPEGALVPLGAVCALAALAGLALRGDRRRRVLLAGFGLAAGLLWTAAYGALFQAPARALAGYEGPVEVTVADWPQATAYGSSVLVRLHPVEGWPVRTLLYLDAPAPDLRPGDGLTVQARLRAADTITGESTDYYYAKGVRLIAYGQGEGETVRPGRPPLWTWPAYVSKALKDRVAAAFPEEAAPLVTALLTGDRSGLSDGDYAALRRSGLAHVIAVSGLHVSFLAGLAAALQAGGAAGCGGALLRTLSAREEGPSFAHPAQAAFYEELRGLLQLTVQLALGLLFLCARLVPEDNRWPQTCLWAFLCLFGLLWLGRAVRALARPEGRRCGLLCFGLVGAAAVWDIWKGTALLPGLSGGAAGLASLALAGLLLFDSNWYFLLLEHYRDVHIWHVTPHPDLMQTEMERKNM